MWPALGDRSLVPMVEQLFSHLLKVINICAHVLDDVTPGPALKVPGRGLPSLIWLLVALKLQLILTVPLHLLPLPVFCLVC